MTASNELLVSLMTPPPGISEAEAAQLLHSQYGLSGTLQAQASERDANFRVHTADGERYVLKIANPAEAPGVTDFQNQALLHVASTAPGLMPPVMKT